MNIIADKNIPYLKGIGEAFGNITYLSGNEFTKESIKNADTLIVRTVTHFDENILDGSLVKLICSATIGYDHIDTEYCDSHGITWKNAPGCNSGSVQQYVASALIMIAEKKNFSLKGKTIGIVGVGNVGKKVAAICEILGMRVLKNDPPREQAEQSSEFVSLDVIKKDADFITFHTPLTKEGEYKTFHLADKSFFDTLGKKPIIINSARGGIIDTASIKEAILNDKISGAIIDCWEKEPDIDIEYLHLVDIATPHIAGYSADGKANATRMSLESIAEFWSLDPTPAKKVVPPSIDNPNIDFSLLEGDQFEQAILKTYNPLKDYAKLLDNPEKFSSLRSNYPLRREFPAYTVKNIDNRDVRVLCRKIGFNIEAI